MENFLYTLLGGLVGLLFSFLLVTFASSWVFKIGNGFSDAAPDGVDVSLSDGDAVQPVGLLDRLCAYGGFPVKPDVGVVARLACVKATYR